MSTLFTVLIEILAVLGLVGITLGVLAFVILVFRFLLEVIHDR